MSEKLSYEFDGLKHAKTRLYYHVVLVTKYRRPALVGLESNVESVFRNNKRLLWSDGYFCESVGHDIGAVSNYIRKQT